MSQVGEVYWAHIPGNRSRGYIGQSWFYQHRKRDHIRCAAAGNKGAFYDALRAHGADAVQWQIIGVASTQERLDELERECIRVYGTMSPQGWNLTEGGMGGIPSAETRANMSAAQKGRKHTAETRAKISAANMGRKPSAESRAKMSVSQKRRAPFPAETRAKMAMAHVGKKHSAETRAKIGGRKRPDVAARNRARRNAQILRTGVMA